MLSEGRVRQIHTYTLHFPPAVINISHHRYPSVILIPLFLCLFSLPLDTNRLRGESSIRPEPLRTPPHGPSRVNIQFLNEFLKIYTYTPLESPKDDQVFFLQGFNEFRQPKGDDGKRFSSLTVNLKNLPPERNQDAAHAQKSVTVPLS